MQDADSHAGATVPGTTGSGKGSVLYSPPFADLWRIDADEPPGPALAPDFAPRGRGRRGRRRPRLGLGLRPPSRLARTLDFLAARLEGVRLELTVSRVALGAGVAVVSLGLLGWWVA